MKFASALLSASLVLLLPTAAGEDAPSHDAEFLSFAAQVQATPPDSIPALVHQLRDIPGTVCVWYEPGLHVTSFIVDINHYLIQVPVPAATLSDPQSGAPAAGTYFIQASFSGADCRE